MITNFHSKKMPKEKGPCKYLSIKKIKMENLIDDDLEKSLSDESDNQADNDYNDETESDDEKDNDESNE